jgi:hypothetical protein
MNNDACSHENGVRELRWTHGPRRESIGTIQNTLRAVGTPRSAVLGGSADVVVVLASQDGLCSVQPQQWQCVTRAKLSAQDDSTDVSK